MGREVTQDQAIGYILVSFTIGVFVGFIIGLALAIMFVA